MPQRQDKHARAPLLLVERDQDHGCLHLLVVDKAELRRHNHHLAVRCEVDGAQGPLRRRPARGTRRRGWAAWQQVRQWRRRAPRVEDGRAGDAEQPEAPVPR